jgi:citrate lyase beta subunit
MASLTDAALRRLADRLKQTQDAFTSQYPGESGTRQPVHTVYGGAHLFKSDTTRKLGELAVKALETYAPEPRTFAEAIGLPGNLADTVHPRVRKKLEREAVEDFRIDFEDGYGIRPDAEEDGHAQTAGEECAKGLSEGTLPPFIGIRIKTFSAELGPRALRTLDLFLTALVERAGKIPSGFVVTLPKVTTPEQVSVLIDAFEELEGKLSLARGALKMEPMIETTQSILDARGESTLPKLLAAARGRCVAAHFGTYDYTASCDITAMYQSMRHPACDFAKHMMKVAYAGTGLWLSDGATTIMPIAPHKAARGAQLSPDQVRENQRAVHAAWRLHADDVRHSLVNGFYQGWDLHPAQLPSRYGAVYGFFLEGLAAASERLKNFVNKAAQATLVGDVFDDAATGQGLLNFFLRGVHCGALTENEALAAGVTLEELRSRSFLKILENRRRQR